ncbi:ComF family protein [Virgibacillus kekensis]|uniref:ComF family protein n=1 Tax=Virgibacillus kekensis TaxID=202261 RepID=A0ABV9DFD6_9BACI
MNCLWCDTEIIPEVGWKTLLMPAEQKILCQPCGDGLKSITGKRCKKCSRISEVTKCNDCIWWEKHTQGKDPLTANLSVFHYNSYIQDVVSRWKYRGDYCLGMVFKESYKDAFTRYLHFLPDDTIMVPIPLSNERLNERGFNQSAVLSSFLPLRTEELLARKHSEKQSKKNRHERIAAENPFELIESINKPVLLADDIYTTGATLRHAALLLKESGSPSIHALTLIRG